MTFCQNRCCWIDGLHRAAVPDVNVFHKSLIHEIDEGETLVGDSAYQQGEPTMLGGQTIAERITHKELRARHEMIDKMFKQFNALDCK